MKRRDRKALLSAGLMTAALVVLMWWAGSQPGRNECLAS